MLTTSPVIPVDTRSANILMNAFAKESDSKSAHFLLKEMIQTTKVPSGGVPSVAPVMLPLNTKNCAPNVVTFNTLIDSLMRCGDLKGGLDALSLMKERGVKPDVLTFTTLIATVGSSKVEGSENREYGANDPDKAFQLFQQMKGPTYNLQPNGKTYCALISVCSRVRRPDLALKTLRMMMADGFGDPRVKDDSSLSEEAVGAWTATIDACGKSNRIDTAIALFKSMANSTSVKPNEITCSCLFDILIKSENIDEALSLLKYMRAENLSPTEYMYTGMMGVAGRLVEDKDLDQKPLSRAIYIELMSLFSKKNVRKMKASEGDQNLMNVFLIFYNIRNPDIVCYNTLLSACARVGDVDRSLQILSRVNAAEDEFLVPNEKTYAELMKCAYVAGNRGVSDMLWEEVKRKNSRWVENRGSKILFYRNLTLERSRRL